jgi:hypothetical protein
VPPTRADIESVRRAVKRLAGEGLIETDHRVATVPCEGIEFGTTRRLLYCRRLLTDNEQAAAAEELAEIRRRSDEAIAQVFATLCGGGS